ncbi:MAG: VOC family protein [Chloroflexi bacterium]|nr:VOC family protein [Chloroflexota bacterium]
MPKITGLNSASIFVQEYDATVDFYVGKLGFTVEERTERASMLRAGDFRLLVHIGGPPAAPPDLAMHHHLWVDDVDAFHRQIVERGADVAETPQDRPWGLRTFHVKDPNGYEWEFVQEIAG